MVLVKEQQSEARGILGAGAPFYHHTVLADVLVASLFRVPASSSGIYPGTNRNTPVKSTKLPAPVIVDWFGYIIQLHHLQHHR